MEIIKRKKYLITVALIILLLFIYSKRVDDIYKYQVTDHSKGIELSLTKYEAFGITLYQFHSINTTERNYSTSSWRLKKKPNSPLDMYHLEIKRNPMENDRFKYFPHAKLTYDLEYINISDVKMNKHTGHSSSENYQGELIKNN
jgi:hypothetical protein